MPIDRIPTPTPRPNTPIPTPRPTYIPAPAPRPTYVAIPTARSGASDTSGAHSSSRSSNGGYDYSDPRETFSDHFDRGFSGSSTGGGGSSGKNPVLFDLNGDGISLTERDDSTQYFNLGGDGYDHRTAWAGAGDGVLVIDADGDGKISAKKEVVFTDWDPSAGSDMEALRQVFDTNQNGLLDAGDAQWASFRIMVTQADGSTVMKTLADLGIQSLTLDADETRYQFDDGSSIDGETVFTRTDGSTGTLMVDIEGHAVTKTRSTDGAGQSVIVTTALDADGSLASTSTRTTSLNGLTVTTSFDHDGDGVTDRVLTEVRQNLGGFRLCGFWVFRCRRRCRMPRSRRGVFAAGRSGRLPRAAGRPLDRARRDESRRNHKHRSSPRSAVRLAGVEGGVDRNLQRGRELVGLAGKPDDRQQFAILLSGHALGAGGGGVGMDAVGAVVGHRHGDVNHLLGQWIDG